MDGLLRKQVLSLITLVGLLLIAATINLCHTDGATTKKDPYCPACNFQSSYVAIESTEVFLLPDLTPIEFAGSVDKVEYSALVISGSLARSPPSV